MNWDPYLVGGGLRPDAMTRLDPAFSSSLAALFQSAPEPVRENLRITSGYRSPEVQARLWEEGAAKYPDPEVRDNWIARPGQSNHNRGAAVDFRYLDPSAQSWVHENAGDFGLHFPMDHEPWHIEPAGSRGGEAPELSFGSDVPAAPQSGMAAMFAPQIPSALGAQQPAMTQEQPGKKRREEERERRLSLAELIRY